MSYTSSTWKMPSLLKPLVVFQRDCCLIRGLFFLILLNIYMVGALQYLTFTCPNLAFSLHQLCQFMDHPTSTHFEAAKRVVRYVKGTIHHGINFSPSPLTLSAFTNADWVKDPSNFHSTTRFLVFLGSSPVS